MTTPDDNPTPAPVEPVTSESDVLEPRTAEPGMREPDMREPSITGPGAHEPAVDEFASGPDPLLVEGVEDLVRRWGQAQSTFVDDPRQAVQEARELVEDVLGRLTHTFDDERQQLEATWVAGEEPSTEELRQALQRYRVFFDRLLAA